jgi:hypothetical protein
VARHLAMPIFDAATLEFVEMVADGDDITPHQATELHRISMLVALHDRPPARDLCDA